MSFGCCEFRLLLYIAYIVVNGLRCHMTTLNFGVIISSVVWYYGLIQRCPRRYRNLIKSILFENRAIIKYKNIKSNKIIYVNAAVYAVISCCYARDPSLQFPSHIDTIRGVHPLKSMMHSPISDFPLFSEFWENVSTFPQKIDYSQKI